VSLVQMDPSLTLIRGRMRWGIDRRTVLKGRKTENRLEEYECPPRFRRFPLGRQKNGAALREDQW